MKMFIDTHDSGRGTFPAGLSAQAFLEFQAKYDEACRREGVVHIRTYAGFGDGRAFCVNLAPDADAVRRAHERVGLPFDGICEVAETSPFAVAGRLEPA